MSHLSTEGKQKVKKKIYLLSATGGNLGEPRHLHDRRLLFFILSVQTNIEKNAFSR